MRNVAILLPLLALFLFPLPLLAEGTQTGILAGRVVDTMGEVLPDVEVELVGPQGKRTALTDEGGQFRFPGLNVGSYQASAKLLGLEAQLRDIRVHIAKTSEVTLRLGASDPSPEDLPETRDLIQVLAVAPLIDRFETRVGASVGRDFLDELPIERIYQSVALLLPGVVGADSGNPNVSGALRSGNLFLVDGVDTTDSTTGLFGLNLSYEALQDVDVTTAAPPVELGRASGAAINVVTRSGDNDFRGSARWLLDNNAWDGNFEDPDPVLRPELDAANDGSDDVDNTVAATLAGPLIPEDLFFFAAFEHADSTFLRPTLGPNLWDEDTVIQSGALKLTLPIGSRHTLEGQISTDSATFASFGAFDRSPGENRASSTPSRLRSVFVDRLPGDVFALQERSQDGDFSKLEWGGVLSQNLTFSATLATQDRRLERRPLNRTGITGDAPHYAAAPIDFSQDPDGDFVFTLWNGITDEGFEERGREQGNLTGEYFFRQGSADHSLRFGVDFQRTRSSYQLNVAGSEGIDPATGERVSGQLFLDFDLRPECMEGGLCVDFDPTTGEFQPFLFLNFWQRPERETTADTLAFFLNDTLAIGRFLFTVGFRFEDVQGEDDRGRVLVDHDSFAPRLGFKYDPKGDGKVLLSATWSRFYEPFLQEYLDSFTRSELFSGFSEYEWLGTDFFGDGTFPGAEDCFFEDPSDLNSNCWLFIGSSELFPLQLVEPNLNLERSSVEELVVSFERQLTKNTSVRLSWIERDWKDLWDDRLTFAGPDDFLPGGTTENLPEAERSYRGAQFLIQKRFANRWQLLASYTWSEAEGNLFQANGRSTFADFSDITDVNLINRFGPAPYDRGNQFKLFANYQIPWKRGRLSLGSALQYQDGTPYQAEQFEGFGLRYLTPRGSLRLEDVWQLDLSAAVDFPLTGGTGVEVKLEVFNVTGEQTRIGVETDVDTGRLGLPRSIADLQRPRSLRLTVGLQF